jgi:ribosomal protein S12 methylthiotransferase accessory factor
VLHDDAVRLALPARVAEVLAGLEERPLERRELARALGGDASASTVVERLLAGALLVPEASVETPTGAFLARWPAAGPAAAARVAASRVVVLGDPQLAAATADELSALGAGSVARGEETLARASLAVCVTGGEQLALARDAGAAARAAHVPILHAALEGGEAIVGPLVAAGGTPCWECARLRQLAASPEPEETFALHEALLAAPPPARPRAWPAPASRLLASLVALEALKALAGVAAPSLHGRVLRLHLLSLEALAHTVLPVPWCPACGGPAGERDEEAALLVVEDALAGWVGGAAGPIRSLRAVDGDDAVPVALAGAVLAPVVDGLTRPRRLPAAGGKGASAAEALLAAAGEAVETYAAGWIPWGSLRQATLAELGGDALDPRSLGWDLDPARPLSWVRAFRAPGGEAVWAPAPLVYGAAADAEGGLGGATSSGLAAGRGTADASLRALCEVVERDAFMLAWLTGRPGLPIAEDASLDPAAARLLEALRRLGADVDLQLLPSAGPIPVVLCLARGDGVRWPAGCVALGADPDPRRAARAAVLEQAAVGLELRRQLRERPGQDLDAQPEGPLDHGLRYAAPAAAGALDDLASGGAGTPLGHLAAGERSLRACLDLLAADGLGVALADVTPPDLAATPFRVVRALVAGAVPLSFGASPRGLGLPRLRAALAGTAPRSDPHPLA